MKIVIAEDDLLPRYLLTAALRDWDYEVVTASDGAEAWQALQGENAPKLAILDWMMPSLTGLEVCRKVRACQTTEPPYLILLTGRDATEDIVAGLRAGANDYVTKPFDREELHARVQVGRQVVELQRSLAVRVQELEAALAQVRQLQGLLPICSYCRNVRDDHDYWHRLEHYLGAHSAVQFSHGVCPECWEKVVVPELQRYGLPAPDQPT